jgi:hypothetical protein
MAYNHLLFESTGSETEESVGSVRMELITKYLDFVFLREDRKKEFLLNLSPPVQNLLGFPPDSTASLVIVWKEARVYYFDVYGILEEIPSIEDRPSVGTLREFLGVVLSKRVRLHRGARTPL